MLDEYLGGCPFRPLVQDRHPDLGVDIDGMRAPIFEDYNRLTSGWNLMVIADRLDEGG